jgi:hypothetical protein
MSVPQTGIEPVAYRLGGGRSIRLSYWGQDVRIAARTRRRVGRPPGRDPGESSASIRWARPAVHLSRWSLGRHHAGARTPRSAPGSRRASLRRMAPACVFTVDSLANTRPAISVFDRPRATAAKTSRSLSVRDTKAAGAGVRGPKLLSSSVMRSLGASTALPLCTVPKQSHPSGPAPGGGVRIRLCRGQVWLVHGSDS